LGPTYAGKTSFIVTSCCFLSYAEKKLNRKIFVEGHLPGVYSTTDPQEVCTKTILRATIISDEVKLRGGRGLLRIVSVSGHPPESGVIRDDIEHFVAGLADSNLRFTFFFDLEYDLERHITMFNDFFFPIINKAIGRDHVRDILLYNKFFVVLNKGDRILLEGGIRELEDRVEEYESTFLALLIKSYDLPEEEVLKSYRSYVTFCNVREHAKLRDEVRELLKNAIRAFLDMCKPVLGPDEHRSLDGLVGEWLRQK